MAASAEAAARGKWSSRLERLEIQAASREALEWARRESLAVMPYRPGLAAATLEAIGELTLACDCWLLAGDVEGAVLSVEGAPQHLLPLEQRTNLRRILGWEIGSADLVRLASLGSKLTPFGKQRESEILDFVAANAATLLALQGGTVLECLFQSSTLAWRPWQFTAGHGWFDGLLMASTWADPTIRGIAGNLPSASSELSRAVRALWERHPETALNCDPAV